MRRKILLTNVSIQVNMEHTVFNAKKSPAEYARQELRKLLHRSASKDSEVNFALVEGKSKARGGGR